jgi:hypothetical protein
VRRSFVKSVSLIPKNKAKMTPTRTCDFAELSYANGLHLLFFDQTEVQNADNGEDTQGRGESTRLIVTPVTIPERGAGRQKLQALEARRLNSWHPSLEKLPQRVASRPLAATFSKYPKSLPLFHIYFHRSYPQYLDNP